MPPGRPVQAPRPWAESFLTIGVTGTNGKTTTTYLLSHAMRGGGQPVLTETTLGYSLNDQPLSVPRTIEGYMCAFEQAAAQGCHHAVIEVTSEAASVPPGLDESGAAP